MSIKHLTKLNFQNSFRPRDLSVNVKLFDTLPFRCPYVEKSSKHDGNLYVSIFFVNENDYKNCDSSNGILLKSCLRPYDAIMPYDFYFTNVSASEHIPDIAPGKSYYFICKF